MPDRIQVILVGGPLAGKVMTIESHVTRLVHREPVTCNGVIQWEGDGLTVAVATHEYAIEHVKNVAVGFHRGTPREDLWLEMVECYRRAQLNQPDVQHEWQRNKDESLRVLMREYSRRKQPVFMDDQLFGDAFRLGYLFGKSGFMTTAEALNDPLFSSKSMD